MALQQSREKAKREVAAIKKKNINKLIRNYIIETTPEIDAKSVIENAVIERRDFEAAKTPLMRPRGLRLAGILTGSIAFLLAFAALLFPLLWGVKSPDNDSNELRVTEAEQIYAFASVNLVLIANHEEQDYDDAGQLMVMEEINSLNFYLRFVDMAIDRGRANLLIRASERPGFEKKANLYYGEHSFSVYFTPEKPEIIVAHNNKEYELSAEKQSGGDDFVLDFILGANGQEYRLKVKKIADLDRNEYRFVFRKNNNVYHQANLAFYRNGHIYALLNDLSDANKDIEFRIEKGKTPALFLITYQIEERRDAPGDGREIVSETGNIFVGNYREFNKSAGGYSYFIKTGDEEISIE